MCLWHRGPGANPKNKTQVDLSVIPPKHRLVIRVLRSDVSKLVLYLISCFLLAALLTPWLYNAGTALGELTEKTSINSAVDYVGLHARKADFPVFFKRSLLIAALLLLLPLLFSMKLRHEPAPLRDSPWSIYLPSRAIAHASGQPLLLFSKWGPGQLLIGFILAAGLLFGMGWLLLSMGWFSLKEPIPWEKAWKKSVGPSITASLLEEIVFRGVFLGIFLRTFRPLNAIILVSLVFAALHFLQPPDDVVVFVRGEAIPEGTIFIDPNSPISGFQLLQAIGMRFQNFDLVLFEFTSLAVVGLILAYSRYATASLWLPIGLHSGWIFAYTFFGRIATRNPDLDSNLHYLIGSDLKEGVVPLATLVVTALLVFLFVRMFRKPGEDSRRGPMASGVA